MLHVVLYLHPVYVIFLPAPKKACNVDVYANKISKISKIWKKNGKSEKIEIFENLKNLVIFQILKNFNFFLSDFENFLPEK